MSPNKYLLYKIYEKSRLQTQFELIGRVQTEALAGHSREINWIHKTLWDLEK